MAARSKKAKAPAAMPITSPTATRPLKAFYHGGGAVDGFGMARFYWPDGDGEREPLAPRVMKKRRPLAAGVEVAAAKVEAIPPWDAPQDYADVDFLVRHYQACLAAHENVAFVQVTIRFGECANVHYQYEVAREWAKSYYAYGSLSVPVISILHAPHLAGSDADAHVHLIILPRRVSRMGWMGPMRDLGGDAAECAARRSWAAFRDAAKSSKTM